MIVFFKQYKILLFLTVLFALLNVGLIALKAQNAPSGYVSSYTEFFHISSGKAFAEKGFFFNAGLPSLPAEWGEKNISPYSGVASSRAYDVYTHYPSGADFLSGLSIKLFGSADYRYFRIFPLLINSALLFIFLNGVSKTLTNRGVFQTFVFVFLVVHTGWSGMHSFAHWSYTHYALLAVIGILLSIFKANKKFTRQQYAALFGLSFFSGLMTYDYFFIFVLSPIPAAIIFYATDVMKDRHLQKNIMTASLIIFSGCMLAYILHFVQVVLYYGSFQKFLEDMIGTVWYRISGDSEGYNFMVDVKVVDCLHYAHCVELMQRGQIAQRAIIIWDYLSNYSGSVRYLDDKSNIFCKSFLYLPILAYMAAGSVLMYVMCKYDSTISAQAKFRPFSGFMLLLSATTFACCMWLILMTNHAITHILVMPIHFYFSFIMIVLYVLYFIQNRIERYSVSIRTCANA